MALQGTLDTFELQDVLRLLSSTAKSGRLRLQTDRGDGSVWLDGGSVVGVQSPGGGDDLAENVFDLFRAREGSFQFLPDELPTDPTQPMDVEPLISSAEERLVEWREIEKVVPSMFAWVLLADELPAPEVTIDAAAWRTVTAIGGGVTVADLGHSLELSEVSVCRLVRDLVEMGLGSVTDDQPSPIVGSASTGTDWGSVAGDRFTPVEFDDPAPVASAPALVPEPELEPEPAVRGGFDDLDDLADLRPPARDLTTATRDLEERLAPVTALPTRDTALTESELADDEADEVARQLAQLSPRAAQAVAAAAAAETDAERDAALEVLDETDASVNRDLLLKFLGSVKG